MMIAQRYPIFTGINDRHVGAVAMASDFLIAAETYDEACVVAAAVIVANKVRWIEIYDSLTGDCLDRWDDRDGPPPPKLQPR